MSPVNRAGSISEFSPRHSFRPFVKISMCSNEKPGWFGYRDLGRKNRDLGNRDKNFPI